MQGNRKAQLLPPVIKVYLAGGMRSNWQDKVIERFKNSSAVIIFIDPRTHPHRTEREYTAWDLDGVASSNVIFGYLEKDNPSGAGLALEIGFARGLAYTGSPAKHVIFVDDPEFAHNRYFGMARACSDQVFETLEEGIVALEDYINSRQ